MKTKATLTVVVALPFLMSLIIILTVLWVNRDMTASRQIVRSADKIAGNAFELNLSMDQYLLYPGERPKIQFRSLLNSVKRSLDVVKTKTPEEQEIVKHMQQIYESTGSLFERLASVHEEPETQDGTSAELREMLIGQLLELSRNIVSTSIQLSRMSEDRMDVLQQRAFPFILTIALLTGVGFAVFSYLLANRIERANKNLQQEVTERKRAEEVLQKRTLELQHLTETLDERVKERTAELSELSARLVSAQENERRRVSYDLHDNVWQTLLAIRSEIERLFSGGDGKDWAALQEKSKKVMGAILEMVGRIRSMQGDLWPYVLDDIGLLATVDWYCREFEKSNPGMTLERREGLAENEIPSSAKIVIYRILQETLSNVARYSRANHVTLGLMKKDRGIEFTVEDNGIGFDPEETLTKKSPWGGLGLLSIKARTELSGGSFSVESAKGKGTTVHAVWPF